MLNKLKHHLTNLETKIKKFNKKNNFVIKFENKDYKFNKNKNYLVLFQGNNDSGVYYLIKCFKDKYKIFNKTINQEDIYKEMEEIKKSVYYQEGKKNKNIIKYYLFENLEDNLIISVKPEQRFDENYNFDIYEFMEELKKGYKIKIKMLGNFYPENLVKKCNINKDFITKEKILLTVFEITN